MSPPHFPLQDGDERVGSSSSRRFGVGLQGVGQEVPRVCRGSHPAMARARWSSGDESAVALDEQFVAEESARAFTVDKESRWPLQGWCQPYKPYNTLGDDSANMSLRLSVRSRWPQGF